MDKLNKSNTLENGFSQFGLSAEIIETLTMLHYMEPTPVQTEVIPIALQKSDIVVKSQTGSGKTAAFAIPVCEMALWEENLPQALVLEPTRELAVQVKEEIFHIGRKKRLKVPVVFGGLPIDKQILTLKQKSHIVVGTPGRIMDHVRRQSLDLSNIQYLVIDEADLMLDMGFLEEVGLIIETLPKDRVIMLFSATIGEETQRLVRKYMNHPFTILLEAKTETIETTVQEIYCVENDAKYHTLLNLLAKENPADCMIFCGTREMVNVLFQKMKRDHIRCGMLHGEMEQRDRLRTIDEFREGRFHFLIATDVAARGIDFESITHIINYDFPTGKETYVHRVGRTGRNGKSGKAISFIGASEKKMLDAVETYIGTTLEVCGSPEQIKFENSSFWQRQQEKVTLKARKGAVFNQTITKLSIGGGKKSKMRAVDIVGTICSMEGILAEDIGIIDIRDSFTYVEILNGKGREVLEMLQDKTIKGKIRKVRITRL